MVERGSKGGGVEGGSSNDQSKRVFIDDRAARVGGRNDIYVDANPDSTKNVNEVGSKEKRR